jgi:MFS superfamily sulfate permease-like transporter
MGIAIASGAPVASGVITGIIGGLVAGSLAGCQLQVSGPAAGLTVVVWSIIQEHGFAMLGIIVILAGLMQVLSGLLKLGQWFRAVSPAVINGMLSGIGILIFAGQFHVMLDSKPKESGLTNLIAIPQALIDCWRHMETDTSHIAGVIGLISIIILLFWTQIVPQKLRLIPAGLIAIIAATALTFGLELDIKTVELPSTFMAAFHLPQKASLEHIFEWKIILEAAALAFIASAETLLSAGAVDRMHQGPRTKYDKELISQGVGNIVCGVLGALPMTGVIARSGANVQAGARTRLSSVMHGLWLLLVVAFLPFLLQQIPTAALAALLVYTGFKLADLKVVKTLWPYGKGEVLIYLATVATIVATDLLTGVITGVVLTTIKLFYQLCHLKITIEKPQENQIVFYIEGAATVFSLPKLAQALESIPPNTELHVHFEELNYIDHACLDLLMNWEIQHSDQGGTLVIDWGSLSAIFRERGKMIR